jgi:chaperonin GroEL
MPRGLLLRGDTSRGGVALLKASLALATNAPSGISNPPMSPDAVVVLTLNFDQDLGVSIIRRALANPARAIYASIFGNSG